MSPSLPRSLTLLLALAATAWGPAPAAGQPSVSAVRAAILSFDSLACGRLDRGTARPDPAASDALAAATRTILTFAVSSDRVVIDLGPDAVSWCAIRNGLPNETRSGERGLLLAAYVAGEVRAQLDDGRADPNPYAGWIHMLRLYRTLQIRDGVKIPEIDALLGHQQDGTLGSFADEAQHRSLERLRQAYGPPAQSPAQPAASTSLAQDRN